MKTLALRRVTALTIIFWSFLTAQGATFTSDTTISFNDLGYEGADIVVTNCTLTVEGSHSFANLQLLKGAILTQSASDNGLRFSSVTVSNEVHVLTATNSVPLNHTNVSVATAVVTDLSGTIVYTNGVDYALQTDLSGNTTIGRLAGSSIPDSSSVLVSYVAQELLGPTGANLAISGVAIVELGSAIDVRGLGYADGFGLGPGASLGNTGGGGGHGGYGGSSATNAPGGTAYDSILAPTDNGCGGGNGPSGPGGAGGGAIKLSVGGLLLVDGIITANGANGTNNHSGGGAGGSVWMSAATITGSGSITANGGDGEPILGGGGGGGCIALYFDTNYFSGALQARGGKGAVYGGAGTLYSKTNSQAVGQLLADNGGHRGTNTLLSTTEAFDVLIKNGAVLSLTSTQTIGSLVLSSNGWVSCVNQWLNILTDAVIQAGGGIVADGTGYSNWVGVGDRHNYNGYYTAGGGGYGGVGALSKEGPVGGICYGSVLQPTDRGSGGGDVNNATYPSGLGGGAVLLTVGRTLTVDGQISAGGGRGLGQGGGGGSGGSIWITTSNLIGSGTISANGGGADGLGGGGGGGRIAIYFQSNTFTGPITAFGGVGGNIAGAGTIYTRDLNQPVGKVLIDNSNRSGTNTVFASPEAFDLISQHGAVATPSGNWNLKSLAVSSNAYVLISSSPVTISGDASIASGGAVIADGTGYGSGSGPGSGRSGIAGSGGGGGGTPVGSGASHGGYGGAGGGQISPGNVYESVISPAQMGSGGGATSGNFGGAGGGAINFSVGGNLLMDGRISADGRNATNQNCGGGSGGTVNLIVETFSGSGLISANGGSGMGLGGSGGGGRVSISCNTNVYTGTIRAFGAAGTSNAGGAGTIYLRTNGQAIAQVIVNNGGAIGAGTDISSAGSPVNLTLSGGGALSAGPSPLFQNLLIDSNSFYYASNTTTTITVLGNATVRGGGGIVVDGAGSSANSGTGAGRFNFAGTGGGYGGFGASGSNVVIMGGTTYGLAVQPTSFGSGGGGFSPNIGGSGGGAVRVNVTGTLALDGKISADGRPGSGLGGGGSGGSVWLSAGNFTGAGIVSANGGSGSANGGGGGGGGRIAITTSPGTNGFTGTVSAFGGSGFNRGGAGSIYTRFGNQNVGQILVDNGGVTGTNTTVQDSGLDVTIRNGGNLALTSSSFMHNLVINSNGWLTVANTPITITGNATIQFGGGIVSDGTSLSSGQGAGRGATSGLRGGGGYGGWGAANPSPFGIAYGFLQSPADTGSTGGSGSGTSPGLGGAGGGAIHLIVTQNLAMDGRISANGNPGGLNSGGGSGGSVWLEVGDTLSGAGFMSVNGGSGDPNFGGGGGGGRISLTYAKNLFTGAVTAFGGGGVAKGGAGTIYFKGSNQNPGFVVVDNGGTIGTNTGIGTINSANFDLTLKAGAWLIANSVFPQTHNVTIASNASFAFPSFSSPLTVTGDLVVQPGGAITADGKGSPGGFGPGVGGSLNQPGFGTTGGGGGHGGLGASSVAGAAGGISYDLVSGPSVAGSGGGNGSTSPSAGGSGGGMIPLNVVGALVNNGSVTANGVQSLSTGGGGGAGGSIALTVGALSGSGIISVDGGPGNGFGGGGGGGRVAIHYGTNSFTGLLTARGGFSTPAGGAGTIYLQSNNDPAATVMVDNGGNAGTNTPLDLSQQMMLTVQNGAVVYAATGSLLLSNLVIGAGGKFTTVPGQTNSDVAVLGNATIEAGGEFSLDGLGYGMTNGLGAGTNLNAVGSGGGYGGNGGASSQSPGGGTYGSASQPIDRGSGGGAGGGASGSEGGGALHLTVGGVLTVNGLVTANGASGFWDDSGGGSGGSIWISGGSIYGSGGILANGGDGEMFNGGGGGGGRAAIYSRSNNFAGTYSILGGEGFTDGQNGSLFFSSNYPTPIVISQTPVGTVTDAVGAVTLLFNTPLNAKAVSPTNFQLMTPGGPLPQSNVVVSAAGSTGLRFSFPLETLVGNYTFTFGPQIGDIFGQLMSQVYTGAFSVFLPVVEGFVTDTNGQPVPGVVLQASGGFSATTGSNGEYALGVLPLGNIITPIKPGYMFVPGYRGYDQVSTSISNENYLAVATIAPQLAAELRGTNLVMHWNGISGVTYQFFFSTNLIDWESSLPLIPGASGPMQFSIAIFSDNPVYFPIGFYRLNAKNY